MNYPLWGSNIDSGSRFSLFRIFIIYPNFGVNIGLSGSDVLREETFFKTPTLFLQFHNYLFFYKCFVPYIKSLESPSTRILCIKLSQIFPTGSKEYFSSFSLAESTSGLTFVVFLYRRKIASAEYNITRLVLCLVSTINNAAFKI